MARITLNVFDKILLDGVRKGYMPARTKAAMKWFREESAKTKISPQKLMREAAKEGRSTKITVGDMVTYFYDPKHKKTLPYYDTFPLIFMIEKYDDGFLGINLHYLPLNMRAKLMDALYLTSSNKRFDEKTKLRISYSILKSASRFKFFKPCVKRYLSSHLKSNMLKVHSSEWDIALFLPTARFKKATEEKVWADSRRAVR